MSGRDRMTREGLRRLVEDEDYDGVARQLEADCELATELAGLLEEQSGDIARNTANAIRLLGNEADRAPRTILVIAPRLAGFLAHKSRVTRLGAVMSLHAISWHREWEDCEEVLRPFTSQLIALLRDQDHEVRRWATDTVQSIAEVIEDGSGDFDGAFRDAVPVLQALLREESTALSAVAALRAIAHRQPVWVLSSIPVLVELFPHQKDYANAMAGALLRYLAECDPERARTAEPLLRKLLLHPWKVVQQHAALAMGFLGAETSDGTVQRMVTELLEDKRPVIREAAARVVGRTAGGLSDPLPR